jgi:hypothetical protein
LPRHGRSADSGKKTTDIRSCNLEGLRRQIARCPAGESEASHHCAAPLHCIKLS